MHWGPNVLWDQKYQGANVPRGQASQRANVLGAKYPGEQTSQGAKCGGVKQIVLNMQEIKQVIASTKL